MLLNGFTVTLKKILLIFSQEVNYSNIFKNSCFKDQIRENQKYIGNKRLGNLTEYVNILCDINGLIRCEVKFKNSPLPYDTKIPIWGS